MPGLRDRLEYGLLLDGPMGSELDRRGVDTSLPLWSARALLEAPDVVRQIHLDYKEAGADVHTANTFRTNPRTLRRAGLFDVMEELVDQAVEGAKAAGPVLGSLAPVEDCYRPDLVPPDAALEQEHRLHAEAMRGDGFLVETMNTVREAVAAAKAARRVQPDGFLMVSFTCRLDGTILSGESWTKAAKAMAPVAPDALLINCTGLPGTEAAILRLKAAWDGPWGAYANRGTADPVVGWSAGSDVSAKQYVDAARAWLQEGASVIGSCCGTGPEFVRALRALLDEAK